LTLERSVQTKKDGSGRCATIWIDAFSVTNYYGILASANTDLASFYRSALFAFHLEPELDRPADGLGTAGASTCFRDGFDLIAQLFEKARRSRLVFRCVAG
jgi:hypothetical protein